MEKFIKVKVKSDTFKDPEKKTAFIEMFGRKKFEEAVDPTDERSFKFTDQQVANMSDREYEQRREEIMDAMAKGNVD